MKNFDAGIKFQTFSVEENSNVSLIFHINSKFLLICFTPLIE